jgi:hypothetical protein
MGHTDAIVSTLEAFRHDLANGKLDGFKSKPVSLVVLEEPCPSCRGTLVSGIGRNFCMADGCRYSWAPAPV